MAEAGPAGGRGGFGRGRGAPRGRRGPRRGGKKEEDKEWCVHDSSLMGGLDINEEIWAIESED